MFEVIVGNIGTVYSGEDKIEALARFNEYVNQSKWNEGRAGGEDVTLMEDNEILYEHFGTQSHKL